MALNRHIGKFFKMPAVFVSNAVMKKDMREEEEVAPATAVRDSKSVRRKRDYDDPVFSEKRRKVVRY